MTRTAALVAKTPRVTHDHNWTGGFLWTLCFTLTLGWLDSADNANEWQKQAEKAKAELAYRDSVESLPNPAIVLDARSAKEFGLRIADIAGGLDGWRARNQGAVK